MQLRTAFRNLVVIGCGVLASLGSAQAQSAQGNLTVTAVVRTSVAVVNQNGQWKVVVANAPDPADNVSSLTAILNKPFQAAETGHPVSPNTPAHASQNLKTVAGRSRQ